MQKDGESGDDADGISGQVGSAHSQAVGKIVSEIGCQVEISGHFNLRFFLLLFPLFRLRFVFLLFLRLLFFLSFVIGALSLLLLISLRLLRFLFGGRVRVSMAVRVAVSALDDAHEFLHAKEGENTGQRPEADGDVVRAAALVTVAVGMRVRMRPVAAVRVRRHGVWNEMKERVTEETAGSERQQDIQEWLTGWIRRCEMSSNHAFFKY